MFDILFGDQFSHAIKDKHKSETENGPTDNQNDYILTLNFDPIRNSDTDISVDDSVFHAPFSSLPTDKNIVLPRKRKVRLVRSEIRRRRYIALRNKSATWD